MSVPFVSDAAVASLQQGVERYRQIVAAGGWPAMPGNTSLRPGDTGAEIVAARRQLALTGDLPAGGRASPVFDARVSGWTCPLPDPQRSARQRLSRFAHLCRAQCLGTGAAEAARDQSRPRQVDAEVQQGAALRARQRAGLHLASGRSRQSRAHQQRGRGQADARHAGGVGADRRGEFLSDLDGAGEHRAKPI